MTGPPPLLYTFIPADESLPIETLQYNGLLPELGNDGFIESLKKHFAAASQQADPAVLLENLKQHAGKEAIDKLNKDQSLLNQILHATQLDIFPILLPMADTSQRGVSVYVDDKGVSKNLKRNDRLTSFANAIGYVKQIFVGDGFIGRVHDSEADDIWKREDFTKEEISSDAVWAVQAMKQVTNKKSASEVEDWKRSMMKNPANVNCSGDPSLKAQDKNSTRFGEESGYTFADKGEELELEFADLGLEEGGKPDKKKVVVKYGAGGKTLYVEYNGKELFGKGSNLYAPVHSGDCSWSIVDHKKLVVTLMKKNEEHWPTVLAQE